MNARNARNWTTTRTWRLLLVLTLFVTMAGLSAPALADDATNGTPVAEPAAPAVAATASATATSSEAATETATPGATAAGAGAADATSVDNATPDALTETPVPAASLSFKPRPAPVCAPVDGEPAAVESGGAIDFDCAYAVKLTGEQIAPAWIAIDWSVAIAVANGWSAQLSLTPGDPAAWTPIDAPAAMQTRTGWQPGASDEVVNGFNNSATLSFRLRLHRPACSEAAPKATLALGANVTLPGHDDAIVTEDAEQPKPFELALELAPLPNAEPVVSITSFAIAPVSFSLGDQVTAGTVSIAIENPVGQCRDWSVLVDVQSFVGEAIDGPVELSAIGPAEGAAGVEAAALPASGQGGPYVVAIIHAGAQPGRWTQTLGFDLTIPGQTSSGGYQSRATASVVPRP